MDYEPIGRRFESCRALQFSQIPMIVANFATAIKHLSYNYARVVQW